MLFLLVGIFLLASVDWSGIYFTDNRYSSKEMIVFAGTGIAMGNAPDAIKAVADYVTDTNQNDGVRKALEKFFNL
jgi:hypothetical protein